MLKKLSWMGLAILCVCLLALVLSAPASAASKNPALDRQAKAMSKAAVKLIKAKGEAAFAEMNKPDSRWNKNGVAIFVCDEKGLELVSSAYPEEVGKNYWDYKDPQGKLVTQEQWKLVKTKGKGWMDTMWTKPGESQPNLSRVHLRGVKVGGKHYLVGAYYYTK